MMWNAKGGTNEEEGGMRDVLFITIMNNDNINDAYHLEPPKHVR